MQITTRMPIEWFGEVSIYFGIGVQVLTSLILGGLLGYDREKKFKSAGIKTNILICLGSTLYTTMGLLIFMGSGVNADPSRIAAQIVSGIGFLGAGAIIQSRGHVVGMTTAAVIWVVAAIGFTIGAGYPFTAAIFTLTILIVLKLIHPIYQYLEKVENSHLYQVEVLSLGCVRQTVEGIINNQGLLIQDIYQEPFVLGKSRSLLRIGLVAHRRNMERVLSDIQSILRVEKAVYFSVSEKSFQQYGRSSQVSLETENILDPLAPSDPPTRDFDPNNLDFRRTPDTRP